MAEIDQLETFDLFVSTILRLDFLDRKDDHLYNCLEFEIFAVNE